MRFGIALRLFAVLAIVAAVGLNGGEIKNRLLDGEYGHYTVVLEPGANAELISETHADSYGAIVEQVDPHSTVNGYVAVIGANEIDKVRSDDDVLYVIMDNTVQAEHHWWDDVTFTLGLRTPRFT